MFRPILRKTVMVSVAIFTELLLPAYSQKPPVVPPRLIKSVKPDCGVGKSCHGVHGVVIVTVTVLTDGTVGDTNVQSGDPRVVADAEDAAKQCKFQPGTFNGKPTSMNFDLKYKF